MTENKGDLISREALKNIAYINKGNFNTVEGIREWIDNAPTVEPAFNPIAEVKFDKEQLQEIVDKAKAEVLASVERPQGEWIFNGFCFSSTQYKCNKCDYPTLEKTNYCSNCGADMRPKPNHLRDCENCVHHSDNGCEVWECEFKRRSS